MIRAYFHENITVKKSQGVDKWGALRPVVEFARKARFEDKTRLVRDINGEEVVSSALVYMLMEEFFDECLTDGDVELWTTPTDLTHWQEQLVGGSTVNRESVIVHNGNYSCRLDIDAADNNARILQDISTFAGMHHRLVVHYRMSDAVAQAQVRICDSTATVFLDSDGNWQLVDTSIDLVNSYDVWERFSLIFNAHDDYTDYQIRLQNLNAASSSIYLDNMSLARYLGVINHRDKIHFRHQDYAVININRVKDFSPNHIEVYLA